MRRRRGSARASQGHERDRSLSHGIQTQEPLDVPVDEAEDDALEVRLHGRSEERPHLPEQDRERDGDRGDEAHLDRRGERLRDAEGDEVAVRG